MVGEGVTMDGVLALIPEDLRRPEAVLALAALALIAALWWLIAARRRSNALHQSLRDVSTSVGQLADSHRSLTAGQQQLAGGLNHVSEAHAAAQRHVLDLMETRLAEVSNRMGESLTVNAGRTASSLGQLSARLEAIDKAQDRIEKLSGNVLSLQDILSNKQTRGAFGEIQLTDIVGKALPPDAVQFQATLSNGKRADCLIDLPFPPGPIVIDAKFPLEPWEALIAAGTEHEVKTARAQFRTAVRKHIRDIAERYLIEGETADGALMFLPSEAVYAELHANFGDVVREGFAARVWVVSPTTCMATLTTLRAVLKDVRMREQASNIRRELGLLHADLDRLGARVGNLDRHFQQAQKDVRDIQISSDKAAKRAIRLEAFDFAEDDTPHATAAE